MMYLASDDNQSLLQIFSIYWNPTTL